MMPGHEQEYRDLRDWQRDELQRILIEIALAEHREALNRWVDDGGREP